MNDHRRFSQSNNRSRSRSKDGKSGWNDNKNVKATYHATVKEPPRFDVDAGIENIFASSTQNIMLIDCAASKTVAGQPWIDHYLQGCSKEMRSQIEIKTKELLSNSDQV